MSIDLDILEFLSQTDNNYSKENVLSEASTIDTSEDSIYLDDLKEEPPVIEIFEIKDSIYLDDLKEDLPINLEDRQIPISGLLEIKDRNLKLVINKDNINNELIDKYNKQLSIYSELYDYGLQELSNVNNSIYEKIKRNCDIKLEKIKSELEYNNNQKVKRLVSDYENKLKYIENDNEYKYKNKINILEDKLDNLECTNKDKHEIELSRLRNELCNYDQVIKVKLDNEIEKNQKLKMEVLELKKEKELLYSLTNLLLVPINQFKLSVFKNKN